MATNVGRVGIVMKGAWSNSAEYEVLDAVTYNNGLYIAKQAVPANTTPTNTTYWQPALVNTIQVETITGTLSDTLNDGVTTPYPTGFNVNNTIVLRCDVQNGTVWSDMYNGVLGVQIALYPSYLSAIVRVDGFKEKDYRLYIMKVS